MKTSARAPVFGIGFIYVGCCLGTWCAVFCALQITTSCQVSNVAVLALNAEAFG